MLIAIWLISFYSYKIIEIQVISMTYIIIIFWSSFLKMYLYMIRGTFVHNHNIILLQKTELNFFFTYRQNYLLQLNFKMLKFVKFII